MGRLEFEKTGLEGLLVLKSFDFQDLRGGFSKYLDGGICSKLGFRPMEIAVSRNKKGVIRGLHYQNPSPQAKVVFCIRGEVFDVAVDIRKGSPTFSEHYSIVLSEKKPLGLFIPPGFAHGFASLREGSELLYLIDKPQDPKCEQGILHDDPDLGIKWLKLPKNLISEKDRKWPRLKDAIVFE